LQDFLTPFVEKKPLHVEEYRKLAANEVVCEWSSTANTEQKKRTDTK
jgi:hypothetical protein